MSTENAGGPGRRHLRASEARRRPSNSFSQQGPRKRLTWIKTRMTTTARGNGTAAQGHTLVSRRVGALCRSLIALLKRLRIEQFLRKTPAAREDRRSRVPTATALLLLVRNLLSSREPLYGVGAWAARHDTRWLDISDEQLPALNDDRVGRALDRLFDADIAALALDVAARAVRAFDVTLDELHNDSTTVTFHGDYEDADRERTLRGKLRPRGHLGPQQGITAPTSSNCSTSSPSVATVPCRCTSGSRVATPPTTAPTSPPGTCCAS